MNDLPHLGFKNDLTHVHGSFIEMFLNIDESFELLCRVKS